VASHLSGAPNSEVVLTISRTETLAQPLSSMHAGAESQFVSADLVPELEFPPSTSVAPPEISQDIGQEANGMITPLCSRHASMSLLYGTDALISASVHAETQGWQESLTAGIVHNLVSHLSPSQSPTATQPLATVALVADNAVFTEESGWEGAEALAQVVSHQASSLGCQAPRSLPFESPRLSRSASPKFQPHDSSPGEGEGGERGGVGGLFQSKSSEGAQPKESSNISSLEKAKPDFMDCEACDVAQAFGLAGSSTSASTDASIPGIDDSWGRYSALEGTPQVHQLCREEPLQVHDVFWGRYFALEGSPQVHQRCLEESPQVHHRCLEEREDAAQKKKAVEEEAARKKKAEEEKAARKKKAEKEEAARHKEAAAAKKAAEEEAAQKKTEEAASAALTEKTAAEKRAKEMEEELARVKREVEEESRLRRAREEEHARLEAEARRAAEEERARMEAERKAKEEERGTEQERREQERLEMLARGAHKQEKRKSPQNDGRIGLSKGADDGRFRHSSGADVPGTEVAKPASPALGENLPPPSSPPPLTAARHAPGSESVSYEASPEPSEFPPECQAGMLKLFRRGCTNQQVMRHFTMVDFDLTLAQVQRFRDMTGISGTGHWVKGIGRVESSNMFPVRS